MLKRALTTLLSTLGGAVQHPLQYSSPAIDAGNPLSCTDHLGNALTTDQRGVSRAGRCDTGAYEYDPEHDPLKYVFLPIVLRKRQS
jgi:hypothetical protein